MLATNKVIKSKEDVINVAKAYFSRWRIEKYFRCKKQVFHFENFRVRKLAAINALNFYITLCMAFLAHISMKPETSAIKVSIIQTANPIKEKVHFFYYRLAKGISGILSYTKEGVRLWFRIKRPTYHQLCLKLLVWIDKRICLPKSGSRGAYLSVSIYRFASLNASDKSKLGTMGRYTRLLIIIYGNSRGRYPNMNHPFRNGKS